MSSRGPEGESCSDVSGGETVGRRKRRLKVADLELDPGLSSAGRDSSIKITETNRFWGEKMSLFPPLTATFQLIRVHLTTENGRLQEFISLTSQKLTNSDER